MKSRLNPVKEPYQEWKRTSSLGADPTTNVVGLSEDLMVALESFFDWQESNRPEARKKTAMMLTQLSGAGPALPSDVVATEISGWMKADEYFKAVAHNKHKANQDEFIGKLFLIWAMAEACHARSRVQARSTRPDTCRIGREAQFSRRALGSGA
jgi:hypothetical protein